MSDPTGQSQTAPCNIGETEIKRRYRIGILGLVLTIITICILEWAQASSIWKMVIFFPVFYALSGFIQAAKKFCFLFGYAGVVSMTGRKKFDKIIDPLNRIYHRKHAIIMAVVIFVLSGMITMIYMMLSTS